MFMKKYCLTVILFVMLSVVFTTCDMDLFANKYLPSTLQGEVNVTIPPGPVTVGTTLTADYDGYEPVEFQWYRNGVPIPPPEGTKKTFTPTVAGTYTVGVKAPTRGEKRSAPIVVVGGHSTGTGDLTGTITRSPTGDLVSGFPITITYTPGTGETVNVSELTYEWLIETPPPAGNFVSVSTDNPYTPTTPGTYKIKVTDPSTGRTTEKILIIGNPPTPPLSGNVGITGSGKTGELLTATYSGGESPVTYEWWQELPPPAKPVSTSNPFTPTEAGRYVVVATVPGHNPKVSPPITVTDTGGLQGDVSLTNEPLTAGDTTTATYIPASGESNNAGDYSYEWINPSGTVAGTDATSPTLTAGTWTVRVTGPDGRTFEKQITVGAGGGGNLFLNADTSPVNSTVYTVAAAVAYVNANASLGTYTLRLRVDCTAANLRLNNNARLIIESSASGTSNERIITHNGTAGQAMFTINGNATTSLTLGNNVTLHGHNASTTSLVNITYGKFEMQTGSKITGHTSSYNTLLVSGPSGSSTVANFIMTGGEITGNSNNEVDPRATNIGGVSITNGIFTMSGGKVSGNNNSAIGQVFSGGADIIVTRNGSQNAIGRINLSGTAEIGVLILNSVDISFANNFPVINLEGSLSGNGGIGTLHLLGQSTSSPSIDQVINFWTGKQIITGINISDFVNDRLGLGDFRIRRATPQAADRQLISNTSHVDTGGFVRAGAGGGGNLFLNADTSPVNATVYTVAAAVAYVNTPANATLGTYTLRLRVDCTAANLTLNNNARLIIESSASGSLNERTITHNGTAAQTMFTINGNATTSLTLGNNITLHGHSAGTTSLVNITNGNFEMQSGSKITGHNTNGENSAIMISGTSSTAANFTMTGGEISGNSYIQPSPFGRRTAGVSVLIGTFNMSGGRIFNNNITDSGAVYFGGADVYVQNLYLGSAGLLNLSGTAEIDVLILYAHITNNRFSVINLADALSGNGGIGTLHLYSEESPPQVYNMNTHIDYWTGKQVVTGASANIADFVNSRLWLGDFRMHRSPLQATDRQPIADTSYINASGVVTAGVAP